MLRLCGWPVFSDTQAFKDMFEALLDVGTELDMARAAALAIFSVQGWLCKDVLRLQLSMSYRMQISVPVSALRIHALGEVHPQQ